MYTDTDNLEYKKAKEIEFRTFSVWLVDIFTRTLIFTVELRECKL